MTNLARHSAVYTALLITLSLRTTYSYTSGGTLTSQPADRVKLWASKAADRVKLGTLDVPRIAIGTIKWVPDNGGPSDARLAATFAEAEGCGLNLFDTAERYGASPFAMLQQGARAVGLPTAGQAFGGSGEALLGSLAAGAQPRRLRRGWPASQFTPETPRPVLASKFTPVPWRLTPDAVVEAAKTSASRLGVDSLDLYQVHMPDVVQPFRALGYTLTKDERYWEGLARCYHQGVVRNVGVCNYGPTMLARCHAYLEKRGVPLASNQINYSLLYRKQGAQETVDWCLERGIVPMAYYPLAMGLLTAKWSAENLPEDAGLRKYFLGDASAGIPPAGVEPLLATLRAVAQARHKTPAQVAINWVISKGAVPVVGVTRPEQARDTAAALGWRLSDEEVLLLEASADACAFEFQGSKFKTSDSKFVGYGFEKWRLD
ncbi:NADP-dependent oxidoreductase domain-containing protein [Pavlovales sp. CCMP2436]|nr:NADP-dependent oxidoreductase domain-containing protein [Pavlovales sp. CCMP2436]